MFRWQSLTKPFFVLAPMEDVTDTVFRRIVASCGKPDVFFTEFTNCDGLWSAGRDVVAQRLQYCEEERPIIAQIWGIHPDTFYKTAEFLVERGFDGIDINFGCPEKSVVKSGACAAMIEEPEKAVAIIAATKRGAGTLPVSVKTRLGFAKIATDEWIPRLLDCGIDALTIHGRTAREMSETPVHWDEIGKAVGIRDRMKVDTVVIGNGDVQTLAEGREKAKTFGVDGIMIGRGIFDNPWLFNTDREGTVPQKKELLQLLVTHVRLFEKTWGKTKNFAIMKKFFKMYVRGFDGAGELREKLMQAETRKDIEEIILPLLA